MNTTRYRAIILGELWWPIGVPASTERDYRAVDDDTAIEEALTTEAGDFSRVIDVRVFRIELSPLAHFTYRQPVLVKDWDSEENELAYIDTLGDDE